MARLGGKGGKRGGARASKTKLVEAGFKSPRTIRTEKPLPTTKGKVGGGSLSVQQARIGESEKQAKLATTAGSLELKYKNDPNYVVEKRLDGSISRIYKPEITLGTYVGQYKAGVPRPVYSSKKYSPHELFFDDSGNLVREIYNQKYTIVENDTNARYGTYVAKEIKYSPNTGQKIYYKDQDTVSQGGANYREKVVPDSVQYYDEDTGVDTYTKDYDYGNVWKVRESDGKLIQSKEKIRTRITDNIKGTDVTDDRRDKFNLSPESAKSSYLGQIEERVKAGEDVQVGSSFLKEFRKSNPSWATDAVSKDFFSEVKTASKSEDPYVFAGIKAYTADQKTNFGASGFVKQELFLKSTKEKISGPETVVNVATINDDTVIGNITDKIYGTSTGGRDYTVTEQKITPLDVIKGIESPGESQPLKYIWGDTKQPSRTITTPERNLLSDQQKKELQKILPARTVSPKQTEVFRKVADYNTRRSEFKNLPVTEQDDKTRAQLDKEEQTLLKEIANTFPDATPTDYLTSSMFGPTTSPQKGFQTTGDLERQYLNKFGVDVPTTKTEKQNEIRALEEKNYDNVLRNIRETGNIPKVSENNPETISSFATDARIFNDRFLRGTATAEEGEILLDRAGVREGDDRHLILLPKGVNNIWKDKTITINGVDVVFYSPPDPTKLDVVNENDSYLFVSASEAKKTENKLNSFFKEQTDTRINPITGELYNPAITELKAEQEQNFKKIEELTNGTLNLRDRRRDYEEQYYGTEDYIDVLEKAKADNQKLFEETKDPKYSTAMTIIDQDINFLSTKNPIEGLDDKTESVVLETTRLENQFREDSRVSEEKLFGTKGRINYLEKSITTLKDEFKTATGDKKKNIQNEIASLQKELKIAVKRDKTNPQSKDNSYTVDEHNAFVQEYNTKVVPAFEEADTYINKKNTVVSQINDLVKLENNQIKEINELVTRTNENNEELQLRSTDTNAIVKRFTDEKQEIKQLETTERQKGYLSAKIDEGFEQGGIKGYSKAAIAGVGSLGVGIEKGALNLVEFLGASGTQYQKEKAKGSEWKDIIKYSTPGIAQAKSIRDWTDAKEDRKWDVDVIEGGITAATIVMGAVKAAVTPIAKTAGKEVAKRTFKESVYMSIGKGTVIGGVTSLIYLPEVVAFSQGKKTAGEAITSAGVTTGKIIFTVGAGKLASKGVSMYQAKALENAQKEALKKANIVSDSYGRLYKTKDTPSWVEVSRKGVRVRGTGPVRNIPGTKQQGVMLGKTDTIKVNLGGKWKNYKMEIRTTYSPSQKDLLPRKGLTYSRESASINYRLLKNGKPWTKWQTIDTKSRLAGVFKTDTTNYIDDQGSLQQRQILRQKEAGYELSSRTLKNGKKEYYFTKLRQKTSLDKFDFDNLNPKEQKQLVNVLRKQYGPTQIQNAKDINKVVKFVKTAESNVPQRISKQFYDKLDDATQMEWSIYNNKDIADDIGAQFTRQLGSSTGTRQIGVVGDVKRRPLVFKNTITGKSKNVPDRNMLTPAQQKDLAQGLQTDKYRLSNTFSAQETKAYRAWVKTKPQIFGGSSRVDKVVTDFVDIGGDKGRYIIDPNSQFGTKFIETSKAQPTLFRKSVDKVKDFGVYFKEGLKTGPRYLTSPNTVDKIDDAAAVVTKSKPTIPVIRSVDQLDDAGRAFVSKSSVPTINFVKPSDVTRTTVDTATKTSTVTQKVKILGKTYFKDQRGFLFPLDKKGSISISKPSDGGLDMFDDVVPKPTILTDSADDITLRVTKVTKPSSGGGTILKDPSSVRTVVPGGTDPTTILRQAPLYTYPSYIIGTLPTAFTAAFTTYSASLLSPQTSFQPDQLINSRTNLDSRSGLLDRSLLGSSSLSTPTSTTRVIEKTKTVYVPSDPGDGGGTPPQQIVIPAPVTPPIIPPGYVGPFLPGKKPPFGFPPLFPKWGKKKYGQGGRRPPQVKSWLVVNPIAQYSEEFFQQKQTRSKAGDKINQFFKPLKKTNNNNIKKML